MQPILIICEGPGRLSLVARGEQGWTFGPIETVGLWPCWSPDGERIAVSTLATGTEAVLSAIELLGAEGAHLRTLHQAPPGAPAVIAPRVPHYVQWAPSSQLLSFVAPGVDVLGLHLSDRSGAFSSDRIATGAPIFHAWSRDAKTLAIHAGTELSIYDAGTRALDVIHPNALGFRAPVFASEWLVYAAATPPGVALMAQRPLPASTAWEAARFDGGVALEAIAAERPTVSVSVTREPDSGNFHELWLVELESRQKTLIAKGPFTAAMWSPSGLLAAVVVPSQTGDGRYSVQVYGRDGRYVAATEAIVPSQDLRSYLGFFDQYLLSHHLWAPDSSALLVAGRLPGDGVAWSFSDRQNDYVWYWEVRKGSPLERVAVGDIAFFRPRPAGASGNGG